MRPSNDTALQRPDLGQAILEVAPDAPELGYVGTRILAPFPVAAAEASYPVIPKEALFALRDDLRTSRGTYNRSDWTFEDGKYRCQERGLEDRVDDRFAALYRSRFDYEATIAKKLYWDLLRQQEVRVAAKLQAAGNFADHNVTNEWDDAANCTPLEDVNAGRQALYVLGIVPNCLVITYNQFLWLTEAAQVKSTVYQLFPDAAKSGTVTVDHLRAFFRIPEILVAGALKNTADKGQNATLAGIWDDENAILCKVARRGDAPETPCIGRTFVWNEGEAGDENNLIVEDYRDETARSQILRVRMDVDERLLASFDNAGAEKSKIYQACGYRITNLKT